MQAPILSQEQYKSLTKHIVRTIETRHKIIPVNSLKHSKYALKKPLYITIEFDKDTVIAGLDDIEAFAYADTTSEAVDKLCDEIIQLYEDLNEDKNNMGPLPEKWLRFLEELIECKSKKRK